MEIHPLPPERWAAFRDLRLRALRSDPDAFGESLMDAQDLDDPAWRQRSDPVDGIVIVAEVEGALIGMAVGGPAPVAARGLAAVGEMWVAPEVRGQGVGTRLLDAVGDWARTAGYGAIGLGVTSSNVTAIALYERHGYIDTGFRMPIREDSDEMIQIMTRQLIEGFAPSPDEMLSDGNVRSAPLG